MATAAELLATLARARYRAPLLGKLAPGFTAQPETEAGKPGEAGMTDAVRKLHLTGSETDSRWRARTICWYIARDVATRSAAKRLWAT